MDVVIIRDKRPLCKRYGNAFPHVLDRKQLLLDDKIAQRVVLLSAVELIFMDKSSYSLVNNSQAAI